MQSKDLQGRTLVTTLRICCTGLQRDDQGRLIEQPDLLGKIERFVQNGEPLLASNQLELGPILACQGAYEVDVYAADGLLDPDSVLQLLLDQLHAEAKELNLNAHRETPRTSTQCGITMQSARMFSSLDGIQQLGYSVEVVSRSGDTNSLCSLDPAAICALRRGEVDNSSLRKVHGEVTGMSRGNGTPVLVQIGHATFFAVRDLSIEEAFQMILRRVWVEGRSKKIEGENVLIEYRVLSQPDLLDDAS